MDKVSGLVFRGSLAVSDPNVEKRKPSQRVSFSMGHTGASRKFP